MSPAILVALLLSSQDDPRRLVEGLRSDSIEERQQAAEKLEDLGTPAAVAALEAALKDTDREVAGRAEHVLKRIAVRRQVPRTLVAAMPGVVDRLVLGEWRPVFLEGVEDRSRGGFGSRWPALKWVDLEALAGPALRESATDDERSRVCEVIAERGFRSAWPQLLAVADLSGGAAPEVARRGLVRLHAQEAVPILSGWLESPSKGRRTTAIITLGELGVKAAEAGIAARLRDPDADVRRAAVRSLGELDARGRAGEIAPFLDDPDQSAQYFAAVALSRFEAREYAGRFVNHWGRGNSETLKVIAEAVVRWRPLDLVPEILKHLESNWTSGRETAVDVLGRMGALEAAPRLRELLGDEASSIRFQALESLYTLGDQGLVPCLPGLLKDPSPRVRWHASGYLGMLGTGEAAAALTPLLSDESPEVRAAALEALGRLDSRESAAKIVPLLKDPEVWVRGRAAEALGWLRARDAAAAVAPLVKDEQESVSRRAATALGWMGGPEAVPALRELLASPDEDRVGAALDALLLLEPREAVANVAALLVHERDSVREKAIEFLSRMEARDVLPRMVALLAREEDPGVQEALRVIERLGGKEEVPALLKVLRGPQRSHDVHAASVLAQIDPESVIRLLGDSNRNVRWAAHCGVRDRELRAATPEILRLLGHEDREIRGTATCFVPESASREAAPILRERLRREEKDPTDLIGALGRLGVAEALPEFVRFKDGRSWSTKVVVARALLELGARDAREYVVALLSDPDGKASFTALMLAQEFGVREGVPAIRGFLGAESDTVRERAAEALGALGAREAVDDLRRIVREAPEPAVRQAAARSVVRLVGKEGGTEYLAGLQDADLAIRWAWLAAAGEFGGQESIPALIGSLKSDFRQYALRALIRLDAREAVPSILPLLEDPDWGVRERAVRALARLEAMEAIPQIVAGVAKDQRNGAGLLQHWAPAKIVAPLIALLETSRAEEAGALLEVVAELRIREAGPQVIRILEQGGRGNPKKAARAAAALGLKEAVPALLRLLRLEGRGNDDSIRGAAAEALGELDAKEAIQELRIAQRTDSCGAAHEALGRLEAREAIPDFLAHLRGGRCDARVALASALGRWKVKEAVPDLLVLLGSTAYMEPESAAEALGAIGDRRAVAPMLRRFRRMHADGQEWLIGALGSLDARDAAPDLFRSMREGSKAAARLLLAWKVPEVKEELIRMLDGFKPETRAFAAGMLLEAGDPRGIPRLLEAGKERWNVSLFRLNALRSPEAWKRLGEVRTESLILRGAPERVLGIIGREAGLAADTEAVRDWIEDYSWHATLPEKAGGVFPGALGCIEGNLRAGPVEAILEPGRLRLLPRTEALETWKRWWKEQKKD